ncbi:hypothetical protein O7635_03315 [Asanoa sp. WMMD1127]|uniref:hypothetical protein n=1 Tax=Asanoa sp. WMMD1127 TaxID=3016107 RepID=UPI0024162362|nr:hypothetical protein [Asanoa sp. WMMD1127]MDG4820881.1 hypothetical protein [Asanoa sp. WMMD1127]
MTSDVQNVALWALRLLANVDDVEAGQTDLETWQGNSWQVEITKKGMHLQDLYSDDWSGTHSLSEAKAVLLAYLKFLLPSNTQRQSELANWEQQEGRPHPSREAIEAL